MNTKLIKQTSVVIGIATMTVLAGGLSAQAQTSNSDPANAKDTKVSTSAAALKNEPANPIVAQVDQTYPTTQPTTPTTEPPATTPETTPTQTTPTQTTPGTIEPGRATRGGSSYVGAGGNIGLGGGETALGVGNFTVLSKIGLTNAVSARPAVVIGDDTTILIPVTYDFTLQPTGAATEVVSNFAPYVGAGLAIATGSNSDVGPMVTAGADVPLGNRFTGTAGVNVGFFDNTSVGLVIGVGYNFEGL